MLSRCNRSIARRAAANPPGPAAAHFPLTTRPAGYGVVNAAAVASSLAVVHVLSLYAV